MTKIRLQRKFLMAPVPEVLLEVNPPLRGLKPLKVLWSTMPENLRIARETSVLKFKAFTPQDVVKVRKAVREHTAYEELARELPHNPEDPSPLQEPEEIDPIYRILASALNVNWVPPQVEESRRRPAPAPVQDTVEPTPPTASASRRVRSRTDEAPPRASTDRTTSTPVRTRDVSARRIISSARGPRLSSSSTGAEQGSGVLPTVVQGESFGQLSVEQVCQKQWVLRDLRRGRQLGWRHYLSLVFQGL